MGNVTMVFRTLAAAFIALSVAGGMAQNAAPPGTPDPEVEKIVKLLQAEDEDRAFRGLAYTRDAMDVAPLTYVWPPSNQFNGKFVVILGIAPTQNELFERFAEWVKGNKATDPAQFGKLAGYFLNPPGATPLDEEYLFDYHNMLPDITDKKTTGALTPQEQLSKRRIPRKALAKWIKDDLGANFVILRGAVGASVQDQWTIHEIQDFADTTGTVSGDKLKVLGYHKLTYHPLYKSQPANQAKATLDMIGNSGGKLSGVVLAPSEDFVHYATQNDANDYLTAVVAGGVTSAALKQHFGYLREPFRLTDIDKKETRKLDKAFLGPKGRPQITNILVPIHYGIGVKNWDTTAGQKKAQLRLSKDFKYLSSFSDSNDKRNMMFVAQADDDSLKIRRSPVYRGLTFLPEIIGGINSYPTTDFTTGGLGLYNLDEAGPLDLAAFISGTSGTVSKPTSWDIKDDISKWAIGKVGATTISLEVRPADNRNPNWCWVNVAYAVANHYKLSNRRIPPNVVAATVTNATDSNIWCDNEPNEPPCSDLESVVDGLEAYGFSDPILPHNGLPGVDNLKFAVGQGTLTILTVGSATAPHYIIVVGINDTPPAPVGTTTTAEILVYDPAATPEGGVYSIPYCWLEGKQHPDNFSRPAPPQFKGIQTTYITKPQP